MAKKAPKDYKPGQRVIVKLSNGRIEEARINHVLEHSDGMKLLARISHNKWKKAVASWHNSFVQKDLAKKEQQPYGFRV